MKQAITVLLMIVTIFSLAPTALASAEEDTRDLPILMYHSVSETQKGVYFVTPRR